MPVLRLLGLLWLSTAALASDRPSFSLENTQPVDVIDHFPLSVGARWEYEWIYRANYSDAKGIVTVTWTSEIEVVSERQLPEGRLIERRETTRDVQYRFPDDAPASWRDSFRREHPRGRNGSHSLLIRGNYVYSVPYPYRRSWIEAAGPELPPDYFFPMSVGLRWAERVRETEDLEDIRRGTREGGDPLPTMYYCVVEDREAVRVPYGAVADAWRIVCRTLPDRLELWFKDGIGEVKETYHHHGTFTEWEGALKAFRPAGSPTAASPESR